MIGTLDDPKHRRHIVKLGLALAAGLVAGKRQANAQTPGDPYLQPFPGIGDPPLLVSAQRLRDLLDAPPQPIVLLDLADWPDYREGHIPGAVHSYWQETIERDSLVYGTVLSPWSDQTGRIAWLTRYGIGPSSYVIVYDHGDGRRAARLLWFLRLLGQTASSALDGGLDAWKQAGFPRSTGGNDPVDPPEAPVVHPQDGFYVVTGQLQEALKDPNTLLLDTRSEDERHDTVDGQYELGMIPGSVWTPWTDYVADQSGRFIAPDDALAKLQRAGATPERRVILYGRFGTDPDQMWLLLKLLAFPSVEVYDWGWVAWSEQGSTEKAGLPSS